MKKVPRRPDEIAEQRVGGGRAGLELGVELDADEPGVIGELEDLDEIVGGADPGEPRALASNGAR